MRWQATHSITVVQAMETASEISELEGRSSLCKCFGDDFRNAEKLDRSLSAICKPFGCSLTAFTT